MNKVFGHLANLPHDKLLHSFYGTLVYLVGALINPLFGIICVVLVAVAKEIYDECIYSGFDWGDIVATVAIPMVLFLKEWQ